MTVLVWDAWDEKLKDNLYDNVSSGKLEITKGTFHAKDGHNKREKWCGSRSRR